MKNDEFIIRIVLKSGKVQEFHKEDGKWVEISTRGNKFPATAEQVLNHLLPALLIGNPKNIEVVITKKPEEGN